MRVDPGSQTLNSGKWSDTSKRTWISMEREASLLHLRRWTRIITTTGWEMARWICELSWMCMTTTTQRWKKSRINGCNGWSKCKVKLIPTGLMSEWSQSLICLMARCIRADGVVRKMTVPPCVRLQWCSTPTFYSTMDEAMWSVSICGQQGITMVGLLSTILIGWLAIS